MASRFAANAFKQTYFWQRVQNPRTWVVASVVAGGAAVYYVTHLENVPITGTRGFLTACSSID